MSSDQRPGKVRVFSSGAMPPHPGRRRGDWVEAEAAPMVEHVLPPVPSTAAESGRSMALAGLFLLGCAIGGTLLAWFGLLPGVGS